jgi:hypothetical protein
MKAALSFAILGLACLLSAGNPADPGATVVPAAGDDSGRAAVVIDGHGVSTHVTGLHYCYEEDDGGEVYINKYDEFLVRRGRALIRARLDSLARIEFTGEIEEKDGERLLKARITARGSEETEASILCHEGGFLKGNVALGEFRLPMVDVRTMIFERSAAAAAPGMRCTFPQDGRADPEEKAAVLVLDGDGKLGLRTAEGIRPLPGAADLPDRLYLAVGPQASGSALRDALSRLAQAGVREAVILP